MVIRRVLLGLITVCLVSLIIFAGVEILPGDACTQYLGEYQADDELLAQCRKDLDLNRPALERFSEWAGGAITGDLGVDVDGQTKISTIVGDRLQTSLLLAFCAMSIGAPLALLLGVITGKRALDAANIPLAESVGMVGDGDKIKWPHKLQAFFLLGRV